MTTAEIRAVEEARIRERIDARVKAVRAKDIDVLIPNYAADVVSFDVVDPLQYSGSDAVRKRLEEWFSAFEGPLGHEIRDLHITAGDDVAFSHCLNRVMGTRTDGTKLDMWWRDTVCYRKIDGQWTITHEHSSVPFDTKTGKASLELQP